jgi:MYXO-CTERM domain-containing protein
VHGFERYWSGSAIPLPFDDVRAADYDAQSDSIWAMSSSTVVKLERQAGTTAVVATVTQAGNKARSLYYDHALGKAVVTWEESVAVIDAGTGGYGIVELPGFGGQSDWYDYESHTLFMGLWANDQGLRSYNVASGAVFAPARPPVAKITGSAGYLMAHHPDGVSLWDHGLNWVRDLDSGMFPHFDGYPGNPHFLTMTSDVLFAYGDMNEADAHQYYVCELTPDAILYDISDDTYPLLEGDYHLKTCYYSPEEAALYATVTSMGAQGVLQIDLEGGEVVQFGASGTPDDYVRNVTRRGDRIVFYGEDGVYVSTEGVPEPGVMGLLVLGGVGVLVRWRRREA